MGDALSEVDIDASRDLLRRPAPPEVHDHVLPDPLILEPEGSASMAAIRESSLMSQARGIQPALRREVPLELPGNRGMVPLKGFGDGSGRDLLPKERLDLLPFLNGKLFVCHTL